MVYSNQTTSGVFRTSFDDIENNDYDIENCWYTLAADDNDDSQSVVTTHHDKFMPSAKQLALHKQKTMLRSVVRRSSSSRKTPKSTVRMSTRAIRLIVMYLVIVFGLIIIMVNSTKPFIKSSLTSIQTLITKSNPINVLLSSSSSSKNVDTKENQQSRKHFKLHINKYSASLTDNGGSKSSSVEVDVSKDAHHNNILWKGDVIGENPFLAVTVSAREDVEQKKKHDHQSKSWWDEHLKDIQNGLGKQSTDDEFDTNLAMNERKEEQRDFVAITNEVNHEIHGNNNQQRQQQTSIHNDSSIEDENYKMLHYLIERSARKQQAIEQAVREERLKTKITESFHQMNYVDY